LHEIIISNAKAKSTNESVELPWMVDGAGLPADASQLLPKMVYYIEKN
jgi:inositol hexakisphosphate/diphosphoinositol-pentakisphosphate kinase